MIDIDPPGAVRRRRAGPSRWTPTSASRQGDDPDDLPARPTPSANVVDGKLVALPALRRRACSCTTARTCSRSTSVADAEDLGRD
ncbi:MAG: hypothetical protein MZV49_09015 [Rhodopseudomonas palustris]|nr:hypothetical protein [Rhodopseudomonas palustris]